MMPEIDSNPQSTAQSQRHPRVHLLDDVWLLTIVGILLAVGIPWLSGGFEVQVGVAGFALLALGAIHIAFTFLASPAHPGRWHNHALTLLNAMGVVLIGFIWAHVGGLQNPMFLMIFVLPVIGSIFLSRWHPFLTALLSVLVVGIVALSRTPELRSYVSGLLDTGAWLAKLFGRQGLESEGSFAGFYAPTGYLVTVLEIFTVVLFACAVAAEYVGTIFERLLLNSMLARSESEKAQELWATLIERLPVPGVLVDPSSLRIVGCSDAARAYLRSGDVSLEGRNLFEVAQFSFVDLVQELIAGAIGSASVTAIHVADEVRLTQVRVLPVIHKKRRLALLTLEDVTEAFCLRAAWDSSEYAALVVDAIGRIRAFNRPTATLFSGVKVGVNVDQLLSQLVAGLPWWEPGLTRRRKMHIEINARIYEVTSSEIVLPGEEQRLYSVSLLPVARAADPVDKIRGPAQIARRIPSGPVDVAGTRRELR
jgi:PAS domain-containing protein